MSRNYLSRAINGRVCLAEHCTRLLPEPRLSCRRHYLSSAEIQLDPLAPFRGEVTDWWAATAPRRHKLEALKTSSPDSLARRRAGDELSAIGSRMALLLLPRTVSSWRAETGSPQWQLPPDGWIIKRIRKDYPDIGITPEDRPPEVGGCAETVRMDDWLDCVARQDHASRNRAHAPFRPITERRRKDEETVAAFAKQDAANATLLSGHANGLRSAIHNNQRGAVSKIFKHLGVDTTIPQGTVVFHQIVDPVGMDAISSREKDRWSFRRHMGLTAGDVVRYDHARSATLEARWLGNLGKTMGGLVGLNSCGPETALRLELAPLRGLFLGDLLCEVAQTHLSAELEVVLPAGTHWKVVAVVDAEHPVGWRHGIEVYKRLRTIQMVEISADDASVSNTIRMTATSEELDALTRTSEI